MNDIASRPAFTAIAVRFGPCPHYRTAEQLTTGTRSCTDCGTSWPHASLAGRAGDLTGKVRDALNTQTTPPNSVASLESVATVLRALHAERHDDEAPTGWREWYTEALEDVAERLELPRDSGKSGTTAANGENGGTGSPDVPNDAVGAAIRDAIADGALSRISERVEASLGAFHLPKPFGTIGDERAHYAAVGMMTEEGEDGPTPEAQAEAFQAIAAEPRPTADRIKWALQFLERDALALDDRDTWGAGKVREIATILDSLGVHCLALEIERDGQAAQLDRIADQAKPIDGTDLAELVQKAREAASYIGRGGMWHGSSGAMHGRSIGGADTANIIDRLVAAVNDQGRRLREAETVDHPATAELLAKSAELIQGHVSNIAGMQPDKSDLVACLSRTRWALLQAMRTGEEAAALLAEAYPAVRLVNDWATWTDASLYGYADAILAKFPLPSGKQPRDSIVDALDEIRTMARGRLGDDGLRVPPSYDDAARDRAADKAREIWPGMAMRDGWYVIVDGIAEALGLVRAQ